MFWRICVVSEVRGQMVVDACYGRRVGEICRRRRSVVVLGVFVICGFMVDWAVFLFMWSFFQTSRCFPLFFLRCVCAVTCTCVVVDRLMSCVGDPDVADACYGRRVVQNFADVVMLLFWELLWLCRHNVFVRSSWVELMFFPFSVRVLCVSASFVVQTRFITPFSFLGLFISVMLRGVSWFDVCLFILKNIRICCKLEIQVSMANEQG